MNKQNLIVFPGGCYGTFFEWLFNFLENPSMDLPFSDTGSSHKFIGNEFSPRETLFKHIASGNKHRFSRIHAGQIISDTPCHTDEYHTMINKDLTFLSEHFDKIIAIIYDQQSVLWQQNNIFDKSLMTDEWFASRLAPYGYSKQSFKQMFARNPIERVRGEIDHEINLESSSFRVENLMGWHKNNIYDFELWELRELMSFYWFTRTDGEIDAWEKNKLLHQDKIMFISINDIKNDFINTVIKSAQHFDVSVPDEMIEPLQQVYRHWLPLQKQINKDQICNQIVNSLRDKIPFDWRDCNLSIVDEAWIQKTLRNNRIEIRCHNLNVFPTNTEEFLPLLFKEKK
jgi:hypothetical protein